MMMLIFLLIAFQAAAVYSRRPMENPDLYQGDITGEDLWDRNAIPDHYRRWTNAVLPYSMDPGAQSVAHFIKSAMEEIESRTCVVFEKYDGTQQNYIRFFRGDGCYSALGRSGGMQTLSLGEGCDNLGSALHEIGHALGFSHEHKRSDRDEYLIIYWENIDKRYYSDFTKNKPSENWLINDFDYDSIMIYDEYSFSIDGRKKVMVPTRPGVELLASDYKYALTASDVERINVLYECNS